MAKRESFEDFYYRNVGIGEGCGCAESVIDVYEAKRKGEAERKGDAMCNPAECKGGSFLKKLAARLRSTAFS